MMRMKRIRLAGVRARIALATLLLSAAWRAGAQALPAETIARMEDSLTAAARTMIRTGRITIDSVARDGRTLKLYASKNASYIPFREDNLRSIYAGLRDCLPADAPFREVVLYTDGRTAGELIPLPLRSKPDRRGRTFATHAPHPLITRADAPCTPDMGLAGRHIALWQSHGYYYEAKLDRWEWQRARIFQTVEDLYTQSYVLPYLVPMLENAGACVLLPRERDTQFREAIVDNDPGVGGTSRYGEQDGPNAWRDGDGPGFAHRRAVYRDGENPFASGTFRACRTVVRPKDTSSVCWMPDIPEAGRYGVYVSYRSVPGSAEDALYTVYHRGGATRFRVNQTMGGGTWIYLGRFAFDKGCSAAGCVRLSNLSSRKGRVVTADAVRFGGGMGNVERLMSEAQRDSSVAYAYRTSGYPRFTEGARYWLQWAGFPDSVYSATSGESDYKDDYLSRGRWVNHLLGGSANAPQRDGMRVPVDMSLAFHTDAGTTPGDSIIGTLGIYYTHKDDGRFPNGVSRSASRDLTDLVQSQIVADIRTLYEPEWSRRGMWNSPYFEAHVPEVPAMLLELLSHQNFADMRYGLDPRFRFSVSRAIYKGILRYLSFQYGSPYTVQPLPVGRFRAEWADGDRVRLAWKPVDDPLEPTARAEKYIVYTRRDDGDFDNGRLVEQPEIVLEQQPGVVYAYKVTAVNAGGESFPSEILSACRMPGSRGTVLVVNGFDRVCAPDSFVCDSLAGFCDDVDHGVPDREDIGYIGSQYEFCRGVPYGDDDAAGFGASRADYETQVIAGNTFDYPAVHGRSIARAGYSFVSCSGESLREGDVSADGYFALDLILGKQRRTVMARGARPAQFEALPEAMRRVLETYCDRGGNLLLSGAYVGTDLCRDDSAGSDYAARMLKFRWRTGRAAVRGAVRSVASPFRSLSGEYAFYREPNPESYVVESPDAIEPVEGAYTVLRYAENGLSAAVAYCGPYRVCTLGFPFEALLSEAQRDTMMQGILDFFSESQPARP